MIKHFFYSLLQKPFNKLLERDLMNAFDTLAAIGALTLIIGAAVERSLEHRPPSPKDHQRPHLIGYEFNRAILNKNRGLWMRVSLVVGGIALTIVGIILFIYFNEVTYVKVGDSSFGPVGYYTRRSPVAASGSLGFVFMGVILIFLGASGRGLDFMRGRF